MPPLHTHTHTPLPAPHYISKCPSVSQHISPCLSMKFGCALLCRSTCSYVSLRLPLRPSLLEELRNKPKHSRNEFRHFRSNPTFHQHPTLHQHPAGTSTPPNQMLTTTHPITFHKKTKLSRSNGTIPESTRHSTSNQHSTDIPLARHFLRTRCQQKINR